MIGLDSGSEPQIKVFVWGAPGLEDTLRGETEESSFAGIVAASVVGPQTDLVFEQGESLAFLRDQLEGRGTRTSGIFMAEPDIVVLSVESDLRASEGEWGPAEVGKFEQDLLAVVHLIKEKLGSHIMILNASSFDPFDVVASYHGLEREPLGLRAHRYNLAVMRVSSEEGISIIDVDRLVAELGGDDVVSAFLEYRPRAALAICEELVRVVSDYGFFDNRPLLPQVGRGDES